MSNTTQLENSDATFPKEKIKALTITKTEGRKVCAGRGSLGLNRFRSHLNEPRE